MEFTLNGKKTAFNGDSERSLLKVLREDQGITSPKDGCSGQGSCGCCAVELDGKTVLSCITPMKKVEGKAVVTTEGLEKRVQDALADAFVAKGGIQCGYCTPGIVMRADSLLKSNPSPSRDEVSKALQGHLCRCTGYKKIVDSIIAAGETLRTGKPLKLDPAALSGKVGARLPKYEARETVLGWRPFVADLREPGMKFGALRFSDHPRARVLKIDVSEAAKLPGVIRIFTSKDVPGDRTIGLIVQDWPLMIAEGEITRYIGDVLCGVVADSEDIAREAAALIKVEYEVLTPICDPHEAMKPGAPQIHASGNVLSVTEIKRGDLNKARKASAFTVKGKYNTQRIEHAFMEIEACVAKPWTGPSGKPGVELFSQTQGAYEDRKQVAKILGLPQEQVNVTQVQNGGGFGGKEDMTVQGHAALFAWLLNAPVKVALSREESLCMHPKRHPFEMEYELGCDQAGKLTFLEARMVSDSGAYASVGMKVNERAVTHATSGYEVPVVSLCGYNVYTNNIPSGAMRGFGVNQAAFAMEACMDELCEKGGFDRWQFRWENALTEGKITAGGEVLQKAVGVRSCLEAVKEKFQKAKFAGIAVGIKNTGIGCGMADIGRAKIVVEAADRVVIHHGWTEMGQGLHTMAIQSLVEATGLDLAKVKVDVRVETKNETPCGMTTSSRGTSLVGLSVLEASKKFKEDLTKHKLSELVGRQYEGEWICDWTTKVGVEKPGVPTVMHYSYGYAAQVVELDETGKIKTVWAAHDAGRIMNPTLFEGQVEGAVHMGLGYAITEDFPLKD
ncbi:MAG: selenium-dependent xanthine dehydrogenase, partial [Oligoflexia bacterium]|nr:selenium-dependent xanthine dehydrogenase [Oligoflexia bacterium]